ncbi:MAG: hypothetical protein ABSF99_12315 [Anaerolineales bacterium]
MTRCLQSRDFLSVSLRNRRSAPVEAIYSPYVGIASPSRLYPKGEGHSRKMRGTGGTMKNGSHVCLPAPACPGGQSRVPQVQVRHGPGGAGNDTSNGPCKHPVRYNL